MGQETEYKTQETEGILLWGYGTEDRIQDIGDGRHTALGLWDRRQENKTQETEDAELWSYGTKQRKRHSALGLWGRSRRRRQKRQRIQHFGFMGEETEDMVPGA